MFVSRFQICLSSATGWILPSACRDLSSSACCARTFTRKPANKFAGNDGIQSISQLGLVTMVSDSLGNF